jgi:serine/threonine protein kinase
MASTPPSSDAPGLTVDGFLKHVLRSGLLDKGRLREVLRGLPVSAREDAAAVADFLVKAGQLSRFQAGRLLKGQAAGLILGPYQILAPIGRGGSSTVFMARDERSGLLVALKLLPPRLAREADRMRARFVREMVVSQRVSHPHLAWTYEAGQRRGVYYLAMEYIPGKTLSRLVHDEGPLRPQRATRLLAEAASGLEHAHNMGLIHRDLKPSNIMVTPHDHAKVLDLGLALVHGEKVDDPTVLGGQGYIVGTMDYIAPEQTLDATGVDRRSDIYSLGCTLYFALTGQPPFPGGINKDKIRRHRHEEPRRLEELRPDLPAGLGEVVRKMMAKDPARRYPSAIALAEDLQAWAAGEPVLPLDAPGDEEYSEAVASLQTQTPSSEFSLPNLTLPDATDPGDEAAGPGPRPPWLWPLLLALGVSFVFLVVVLILAVLAIRTP